MNRRHHVMRVCAVSAVVAAAACGSVKENDAVVVNAIEFDTQGCQRLAEQFGIVAGGDWGFAPNDIQRFWTANNCSASYTTSSNLCQKASDIYGIVAGATAGFAPNEVQQWFEAHSCGTAPLVEESLCKRAADVYDIQPGHNWGTAPPYIRSWWQMSNCNERPHDPTDVCQMLADFWGIVAGGTWGFAPPPTRQWWTANFCNATTTTSAPQLCQNMSNFYSVVGGGTWGGTPSSPADVRTWWTSHGCNTQPTCQEMSEMFGIQHNVTWGYAGAPASPVPNYVQIRWQQSNCSTDPLFSNDACQRAADTLGLLSAAAAPDFVAAWYNATQCHKSPGHTSAIGVNGVLSGPWFYMPNFYSKTPPAPTNLVITNKVGSTLSFSIMNNGPTPTSLRWREVHHDGTTGNSSVIFNVPHGQFNGSIGVSNFQDSTTPCILVSALSGSENAGDSMASNTACWSVPAPTVVNLGLSNGVFFCTPDLNACDIEPTLGSQFKVVWGVCNNGSIAAGATTTKVVQTNPNGDLVSVGVSLAGVSPGTCQTQTTQTISVGASGHWNWDVYVDALNQVAEKYENDNFGGIGTDIF